MNLFQRTCGWIATRAIKWGGLLPQSDAAASLWGYTDTAGGVQVNERTALNYSAVFAAVRLLSESVGTLPTRLVEHTGPDESRIASEHPVDRLLFVSPNPEMTPAVFFTTLQAHCTSWGNSYAEIERNKGGVPIALWPMTPDRTRPVRMKDGSLSYSWRTADGTSEYLPASDVLHVPGLGFDGLAGYSPIALARESIGLGLATERFGAALFGSGAQPGGILTHPGKLTPEAKRNLKESWNLAHQGPYRAHRVAVLEEGLSWQQVTIPPEDAQFLETRKFSIVEIARWFNVPPHMLRDLEHATFSNIEHQGIEFVTYSLRPWLVRWQQEIRRKLLTPAEQLRYGVMHQTDELERADAESRNRAYATGRQWGWLSADDIRKKEGQNPLPDGQGKLYLTPANMSPAGQAGEPGGDGDAKGTTVGDASGGDSGSQ